MDTIDYSLSTPEILRPLPEHVQESFEISAAHNRKKKRNRRSKKRLSRNSHPSAENQPNGTPNLGDQNSNESDSYSAEKRKRKLLPKDWAHLTPVGSVIADTPFIPFKTPFNRLRSYPRHLRADAFTTKRLLCEMDRLNLQLGMVVDLTDTDRYYQPLRLLEAKIKYVKIRVPGKGVPTLDSYQYFCSVVDGFLRRRTGTLIGVHCTHGINRTGWFICRFLMERFGMNSEAALLAFDQARGHSIYRDYIIQDLHSHQLVACGMDCQAVLETETPRNQGDRPEQ